MDKYSVYVGMDVHARSVTAQALDKNTGEFCKKRCPRYHGVKFLGVEGVSPSDLEGGPWPV